MLSAYCDSSFVTAIDYRIRILTTALATIFLNQKILLIMKQLILCLFGIAIIMSSCSKDQTNPIITSGPSNVPQDNSLDLKASHWIDNQDGTFTCTFKDILSYSSNSHVSVFLKNVGYYETQITESGIAYMDGVLKYKITNKDLSLIYDIVESRRKFPFSSLDIHVVFQP